jgi:hypothetical protein
MNVSPESSPESDQDLSQDFLGKCSIVRSVRAIYAPDVASQWIIWIAQKLDRMGYGGIRIEAHYWIHNLNEDSPLELQHTILYYDGNPSHSGNLPGFDVIRKISCRCMRP